MATYQSVSGAGKEAVDELAHQTAELLNGRTVDAKVIAKQIAFNCVPQIDVFQDNGYTKEEMKMFWETQKILEDKTILVNATAVRVPVFFGHSEAVHIETQRKLTAAEARQAAGKGAGRHGHGRARARADIPRRPPRQRTTTRFMSDGSARISPMSGASTCGSFPTTCARELRPTACRLPRYWFASISELSYIAAELASKLQKSNPNLMFSKEIHRSAKLYWES